MIPPLVPLLVTVHPRVSDAETYDAAGAGRLTHHQQGRDHHRG